MSSELKRSEPTRSHQRVARQHVRTSAQPSSACSTRCGPTSISSCSLQRTPLDLQFAEASPPGNKNAPWIRHLLKGPLRGKKWHWTCQVSTRGGPRVVASQKALSDGLWLVRPALDDL